MIKHWTKFEGKPNGAARDEARVTMHPSKTILLNRIAFEGLGEPAAVELMFDETRKVIGLKPIDPRRPNAFPLKPKKDSYHRTIHAGAFLTHFRIRPENTVLFQQVEIDNEGVMELDLSKAINVGRGSR